MTEATAIGVIATIDKMHWTFPLPVETISVILTLRAYL